MNISLRLQCCCGRSARGTGGRARRLFGASIDQRARGRRGFTNPDVRVTVQASPVGETQGDEPVEFQDSPEEAAFRAEVRSFIQEHFTDRMKSLAARDLGYNMENASPDQAPLLKEWRQALASRGWITPHWPKEYGGAGMTPIEQFIF